MVAEQYVDHRRESERRDDTRSDGWTCSSQWIARTFVDRLETHVSL